MHVNTGEIFDVENDKHLEQLQKEFNNKLIPLTNEQAEKLKPLSKRLRKFLMKKGSCVCGSGKSFKKCCLRKYK